MLPPLGRKENNATTVRRGLRPAVSSDREERELEKEGTVGGAFWDPARVAKETEPGFNIEGGNNTGLVL